MLLSFSLSRFLDFNQLGRNLEEPVHHGVLQYSPRD